MSSSPCECSICLSEITETTGKVSMSCQHSFHFRCISNWFIEQVDNEQSESCPYCRREVSEDEGLPKIDELSVEDEESEDEESEIDSETDFDSDSEAESEVEDVPPRLNTELILLADRLHTDLHSLEAYKRGIQIKVRDEAATLTDQSILNRILAYEVDMKENLQKLLEMEELQVWRMGSSAPAAPPSTPQGHDQKVAEWRAKVDALWPSQSRDNGPSQSRDNGPSQSRDNSLSIQAPFNPEDEDEDEEDPELRRRMHEKLMRQIKGIGAVVGRG
jgi:Ring finger domain